MHKIAVFVAMCCLALASHNRASATTTTPMTLAQMIEASATVARMRVVSIDEAAFDTSEKEAYTRVEGEALEVLVGDATERISFLVRGGLLPSGDRVSWGELGLEVGETYLVFLRADYRITPVLAAYREITLEGKTVLVNAEGQLVEWSEDFPLLRDVVVEEKAPAVQKGRVTNPRRIERGPRRPVRALPARAQSRAQIVERIRFANTFRVARKLQERPSKRPLLTLEAP